MRKELFRYKPEFIFLFIVTLLVSEFTYCQKAKQEFYQIKIYHLKSNEQIHQVDEYLQGAYLPALHNAGIKKIGVFKPVGNDTAAAKSIYVLIAFNSAESWINISDRIEHDALYKSSAKGFLEAASTNPSYERIESILLKAFSGQPHLVLPTSKSTERIFELRSYESPTEKLYEKKVAMFNTGGEIPLFTRLGFNPVFYAKVLSGSHMPNFMYMPVFESIEKKDAQWKSFGEDAQWKDISTRPENENKVSVSHIDSIIMRSAEYSDF